MWRCAGLAVALSISAAGTAAAQIAVSANDAKVKLVDGKVVVQKEPPPDTVSIIDLGQPASDNLAVTGLRLEESYATPARAVTLAAEVGNFGAQDRTRVVVEYFVDGRRVGEGFVDVAAGGRAAFDRLRETPYDLIVSDMRMPEGDGEELYRNALTLDADHGRRFIFITGDTATEDAWSFLEGTDIPVVEKPFKPRMFEEAVYRVITAATPS